MNILVPDDVSDFDAIVFHPFAFNKYTQVPNQVPTYLDSVQGTFDHKFFGLMVKKLLAGLGRAMVKLGQLGNILKYTSRQKNPGR